MLKGTKTQYESKTIENSNRSIVMVVAMILVVVIKKYLNVNVDQGELTNAIMDVMTLGSGIMVVFFNWRAKLARIEATKKIRIEE